MKKSRSLLIILLVFCGFELMPDEKIFPVSLKRTENINEEKHIKSGNYIKVFYEHNKPVNGIIFINNENHGELIFEGNGFLSSFSQSDIRSNDKFLTNYIYQNNKLINVRTSINNSAFIEMKFVYNSNDFIENIQYINSKNNNDSSQRHIIEFFYKDNLLIKRDLKTNQYEKHYFKQSRFKIEYLDPIFYFMYKPYLEQNKIINKIEYFSNGKIIKTDKFDEYGNVLE